MGYLNTQLEKVAAYLSSALLATALGGGGGAAIGSLNSEKEDRLASILGGATGGSIGGVAGLKASLTISDVLDKSKRIARLLKKHPKLEPLLTLGLPAASLTAIPGIGAYTGSGLAKKLKKISSE